jgi:S-DNA-T family DNA segregation ATPase FtsK/SpoIIIE
LVVSWVVRFGARHPFVALVVAVTGFVYWEAGEWAAGLLLGGLAAGMALWRRWDRESFTAAVTLRVRASWRSWRVYGRRWRSVMTLAGLTARFEDRVLAPKLHHVAVRDGWDRLTVQMIEGQRPDDYTAAAERLAHAFGAISCRARRVVANTGQVQPGVMWLDFHYHDPLADVVPAIPLPTPDDDGRGA